MREIKFRAWDKKSKKLTEPWIIRAEGQFVIPRWAWQISQSEFEIMQFTGLKDKNEKEIYEGDICEIPDFYPDIFAENGEWKEIYLNTIGKIIFIDGCFMINDGQEMPLHAIIGIKEIEIIGNIYENPELL